MSAKEKFQRFLISILLSVGFFYGGFYYGKRGYEFEIRKNPPKISIVNKNKNIEGVDFKMFWQVWDMVSAEYLNRPVDPQKMLYGAISGMVAALGDPYSAYFPPEQNEEIMNSINSTYQGIGAELSMKEGQIIVVAPLDGSPAKAQGIRAGDKILAIDDKTTLGITVTEAVMKIRGTAGTQIKLTVQTADELPRELTITRDLITVASVTWEDKGEGTAYIRISRFGQETNAEWDKVVKDIGVKMNQLDAIVLDLRGNPGGYMFSAVYIAGDFFSNKDVVIQQSATGEEIPYKSPVKSGAFVQVPAVYVLIDEGSASASEILAAALRDQIKAKLLGVKSFGKGTIQDARDFEDGSGIHITTGKWLTPTKEWVHEVGISPEIEVKLTEDDLKNQNDAQLNKALELAKEI